ncbi:MAG: ketopantoate reductase family protein [Anaerolineales bacterium]
MKWLFFGAGAIGSYIGGSLLLAGNDVAFLERPPVAQILRRQGLCLSIDGVEHRIPPTAVYTDPAETLREHPPDLMVFALKSYDTAAAVESLLSASSGRLPPALCLQNGVENEALIETAFGKNRVIAGTVTSAVGRVPEGTVRLERKRGMGIARGHPLSRPAVAALDRAGLNARLFPDARSMKWSKLLTNLTANAATAILGMNPQAVYADRRLFLMDREMLRECLRVMDAAGTAVTDLPGTPVRALAFAVRYLPAVLARPLLARAVGGGRGGKMPSFYLDLASGRGKTEADWLNGAVVRAGLCLGVPTPVNRTLTDILRRLAEDGIARDSYHQQPERLLSELPRDSQRRIGGSPLKSP